MRGTTHSCRNVRGSHSAAPGAAACNFLYRRYLRRTRKRITKERQRGKLRHIAQTDYSGQEGKKIKVWGRRWRNVGFQSTLSGFVFFKKHRRDLVATIECSGVGHAHRTFSVVKSRLSNKERAKLSFFFLSHIVSTRRIYARPSQTLHKQYTLERSHIENYVGSFLCKLRRAVADGKLF